MPEEVALNGVFLDRILTLSADQDVVSGVVPEEAVWTELHCECDNGFEEWFEMDWERRALFCLCWRNTYGKISNVG
jgi:hypothetical protein